MSGVATPPGANVPLLLLFSPLVDRNKPPSRARSEFSRDPARRSFSAFSFSPLGDPGGRSARRAAGSEGNALRRGCARKPRRGAGSALASDSGDSDSSSDRDTHVSLEASFAGTSILAGRDPAPFALDIFAFAAAAARPSRVAVTTRGCRRASSASASEPVSSLLATEGVDSEAVTADEGARGDLPIIFSRLAWNPEGFDVEPSPPNSEPARLPERLFCADAGRISSWRPSASSGRTFVSTPEAPSQCSMSPSLATRGSRGSSKRAVSSNRRFAEHSTPPEKSSAQSTSRHASSLP
mmetsp:Transcript_2814/g.11154  ORF Transcript_2814/g.11154 Transcript_2814/m.11154 type:complete len:296 (+) Transcript_2814:2681-3568(+)